MADGTIRARKRSIQALSCFREIRKEFEMVPIRGVEPPTFALRMRRYYIFTPLKTYS